jgi:hypothetical protein
VILGELAELERPYQFSHIRLVITSFERSYQFSHIRVVLTSFERSPEGDAHDLGKAVARNQHLFLLKQ